jgi:hypothetical protein
VPGGLHQVQLDLRGLGALSSAEIAHLSHLLLSEKHSHIQVRLFWRRLVHASDDLGCEQVLKLNQHGPWQHESLHIQTRSKAASTILQYNDTQKWFEGEDPTQQSSDSCDVASLAKFAHVIAMHPSLRTIEVVAVRADRQTHTHANDNKVCRSAQNR